MGWDQEPQRTPFCLYAIIARSLGRSLTDDDLDRFLLGVSSRPFVADPRTPEQEAEGCGVGGVVEVHLLGLHLAVVHNPHLQ